MTEAQFKLIKNIPYHIGWVGGDGKTYAITGFSNSRVTFSEFASIEARKMMVQDFRVFFGGGIEAKLSIHL